jgi:hypothetical protein
MSESQPDVFLSEVYEAVKELFFGRFVLNKDAIVHDGDEIEFSEGWHGLYSDIDTEMEVELVIRFFPNILTERLAPNRFTTFSITPIHIFFSKSKAIFFVPLFVKLCAEMGRCEVMPCFLFMKLLLVPGKETFAELFREEYAALIFGEEASAEESDEESLLARMCMREMARAARDIVSTSRTFKT